MIAADKHTLAAALSIGLERSGPMPADIVEAADFPVVAAHQDQRISR
jgi:hypothetical protein